MIRVTHVLWNGDIGGIERLVHDVALAQRELGLDVRVAFATATGPFADRLRDAGVPVVDLGIRSGYDVRPRALLRARRALAGSDVLHVHGWNVPIALVTAGRRIVDTEHGVLGLERRQTPLLRVKRAVQRGGIGRAAIVATPSAFTADRVAASTGFPRARIRVVPNGIACRARSTTAPTVRDEVVVAVVGRLVGMKRVDRVLDALVHVPPGVPVRVVVAGSGPLEDDLRAAVVSRRLGAQVRFLGAVADVPALLAEVDALVLPTSSEPFGLVVLEAAAAGALPIVFADAGGALEILPDDGLIVRDERELGARLAHLRGSDALSHAARARRAEWAVASYPIAKTAARYRDLYVEAIAGPPPLSPQELLPAARTRPR